MEIKLTQTESLEYFFNALCNGLSSMRDYGLEFRCPTVDYTNAKLKLLEASPNTIVCFEDVLIQVLKDGGTLKMIDTENGEDDKTITINEVYERVQKTPIRHLMNMINGEDDAETADVILQTVFYEDVLFG